MTGKGTSHFPYLRLRDLIHNFFKDWPNPQPQAAYDNLAVVAEDLQSLRWEEKDKNHRATVRELLFFDIQHGLAVIKNARIEMAKEHPDDEEVKENLDTFRKAGYRLISRISNNPTLKSLLELSAGAKGFGLSDREMARAEGYLDDEYEPMHHPLSLPEVEEEDSD